MKEKKNKLLDRVMRAMASMQDNFRAYQQIKVIVRPTALELYREMLPRQFDMPGEPLVLFIVVDNVDVAPWPMTPYQEGMISLRCSYQDQDGWYALTMPVNRWVAMASGRMIGFPKYLAKEITLAPSGSGWRGEVLHDGSQRLLLEFEDASAQAHVAWQEKSFAMFNLTRQVEALTSKRQGGWKAGQVKARRKRECCASPLLQMSRGPVSAHRGR